MIYPSAVRSRDVPPSGSASQEFHGVSSAPRRMAEEQTILRMASRMEPDRVALMSWLESDPIIALGGSTARALIADGHAWQVIQFLRSVLIADVQESSI